MPTTLRAGCALLVLAAACGGNKDFVGADGLAQDEAGLGDVGLVEGAGAWGAATTCKTLPTDVPRLNSPAVVVSLDGLTLHVWDRQGTFDKVYPIGPGAIENGKSLTPTGHFTTGPRDTTAGAADNGSVVGGTTWSYWYRCKMWWKDPDTGKWSPVFAGLPFIRLMGTPTSGYGIHGPIDNFGAANGGSLRRGYVSHGCIRMQSADVLELYMLLHGHDKVPVTVQRAVERDDSERAVDIPQKWIGSECTSSSDCNFAGGVCKQNAFGGSFCTMACGGSCPDRAGEQVTACVPDGSGSGMCVRQANKLNAFCRNLDSFEYAPQILRYGRTTRVDACVPGSSGFVGDPCLANSDCASGRRCERAGSGPGLCTQSCTSSAQCPIQNGLNSKCVAGRCLRYCDVQDACGIATSTTCRSVSGVTACVP